MPMVSAMEDNMATGIWTRYPCGACICSVLFRNWWVCKKIIDRFRPVPSAAAVASATAA